MLKLNIKKSLRSTPLRAFRSALAYRVRPGSHCRNKAVRSALLRHIKFNYCAMCLRKHNHIDTKLLYVQLCAPWVVVRHSARALTSWRCRSACLCPPAVRWGGSLPWRCSAPLCACYANHRGAQSQKKYLFPRV